MQGNLVSLSIESWDRACPAGGPHGTPSNEGTRRPLLGHKATSLSIGSGGLGVTGGLQGRERVRPPFILIMATFLRMKSTLVSESSQS